MVAVCFGFVLLVRCWFGFGFCLGWSRLDFGVGLALVSTWFGLVRFGVGLFSSALASLLYLFWCVCVSGLEVLIGRFGFVVWSRFRSWLGVGLFGLGLVWCLFGSGLFSTGVWNWAGFILPCIDGRFGVCVAFVFGFGSALVWVCVGLCLMGLETGFRLVLLECCTYGPGLGSVLVWSQLGLTLAWFGHVSVCFGLWLVMVWLWFRPAFGFIWFASDLMLACFGLGLVSA